MSDPTNVVVLKSEYWIRVSVVVKVCIKEILLDILHDPKDGLPKDKMQLHILLSIFKNEEEKNLRHVLKAHQWEKICHACSATCQPKCAKKGQTDSQDLDITSIIILIIHQTKLTPPLGKKGWKQVLPLKTDTTKAAFVLLARKLRNDLIHCSFKELCTKQQFDNYWKRIEDILLGLGYRKMALFNKMKVISLEPYLQHQIDSLKDKCVHLTSQKCDKEDLKQVQTEIDSIKVTLSKNNEKKKRKKSKEQLNHLLFVGNPGVGKSTLLNCIMNSRNEHLQKKDFFQSGISIGSGMTYQLDTRKFGNIVYLDTPGLKDRSKRIAAAESITKALKKNGSYKIVFVMTLESGRIKPDDITTMKLVLESAQEITNYGVIFNKFDDELIEKLDATAKQELRTKITIKQENKPVPYLFFIKWYSELGGKNDALMELTQLHKFVTGLPPIKIHDYKVDDLSPESYEELNEMLKAELSKLAKENRLLKRKTEEDQKHFERRLKESIRIEGERQKKEIEDLRSNQQRIGQDMSEIQLKIEQQEIKKLMNAQLEEVKPKRNSLV